MHNAPRLRKTPALRVVVVAVVVAVVVVAVVVVSRSLGAVRGRGEGGLGAAVVAGPRACLSAGAWACCS